MNSDSFICVENFSLTSACVWKVILNQVRPITTASAISAPAWGLQMVWVYQSSGDGLTWHWILQPIKKSHIFNKKKWKILFPCENAVQWFERCFYALWNTVLLFSLCKRKLLGNGMELIKWNKDSTEMKNTFTQELGKMDADHWGFNTVKLQEHLFSCVKYIKKDSENIFEDLLYYGAFVGCKKNNVRLQSFIAKSHILVTPFEK